MPKWLQRILAEVAIFFNELKHALGIAGSSYHGISPTQTHYDNEHFISGVETGKIIEAGLTGLKTPAGDLMIIRAKPPNSTSSMANFFNATKICSTFQTDDILEIREP